MTSSHSPSLSASHSAAAGATPRPPAVSILLPAFNEGESICAVLKEIKQVAAGREWEIVVIDDGSLDQTRELALECGVTVVSHPRNLGYGAALKTGMRAARGDLLVTFDADGQHDPADILSLLECLDQADLVVGVRTGTSATGPRRNIGRWIVRRFASYLVRRRIPDLNSGLRAIRRTPLRRISSLLPNGYSFSTTTTLALIYLGYRVAFQPISIRHRTGGHSPVKLFSDGLVLLHLLLRISCLFGPLRFFGLVSLTTFLPGVLYAGWGVASSGAIPAGAGIALLGAMLSLLLGIVCDQVSALRFSMLPDDPVEYHSRGVETKNDTSTL